MKWVSFKDKQPEKTSSDIHFLVTDGKKIYCGYWDYDEFFFHADISENYYEVEGRLTHWCYFQDIPFPDQPERSKREDSSLPAVVRMFSCGCFDTDRFNWNPLCNNEQHKKCDQSWRDAVL